MDVVGWLSDLGLAQYAAAFQENAVDGDTLPSLTSDDLREIGVGPVGHRRRLLDAIAALKESKRNPTGPTSERASALASSGDPPPNTSAERRLLTLMFVDLVGSTAMSSKLDPEDMRAIIAAYHKAVAQGVQVQQGFVAKYMGDGVLAYFGYPFAQEDDAERAIRAGLEICGKVSNLRVWSPDPLSARIGIATGIVVVGDLVGSGESSERGVVGDTPNLAARLQGVADTSQVVVAEETRRLVGNLFDFADLGEQNLKGIPRPVRAHLALRSRVVESRFDALKGEAAGPLVGREAALAQMREAWSQTARAKGRTILVFGEAGIGKSRLTTAFMEQIRDETHARARYYCAPQDSNSAFAPFLAQFERAAGFQRDEDAGAKLVKHHAFMEEIGASSDESALVAASLGVADDGMREAIEALPSHARRQKLISAFVKGALAHSGEKRTLLVFEDAHWADPSSLEVLGQLIERLGSLGVLLLITFRPEFDMRWPRTASVASIGLNRLSAEETLSLIRRNCERASLSEDVIAEIVERTDGIPLFVEEVTKAIVEARADASGAASGSMAVPVSLQASLTARLDRLGRARELAQIGAAMGREFPYRMIQSVAPFGHADLDLALDHLCESGILFRSGFGPDATFLFKHALLQDAAYGMMLREVRKSVHSRIADSIQQTLPELANTKPETVARHLSEAARPDEAAKQWSLAGLRSVSQSAYVEGIAFLSNAIAELALTPFTSERRRQELKCQLALAGALFHVQGYTSSESMTAFDRARAMFEQADSSREPLDEETNLQRYALMYGVWIGQFVAGSFPSFEEKANRLLAAAEKQTLSEPLLMAHRVMGATCAVVGDLPRARFHLDKVIDLYDSRAHSHLASRLGHDLGVAGRAYRAYVLYRLGIVEEAQADANKAVEIGRDLGQIGTLAYALLCAAIVQVNCGVPDAAKAWIEELLALAETHSLPYWRSCGRLIEGEYLAAIGEAERAIASLDSGLDGMRRAGTIHLSPQGFMWRAKACSRLGRHEEAATSLDRAFANMEETNERWDEAEIRRTAGELSLLRGESVEVARSQFIESLTVARRQGARLFGMRALASLSKLPRTDQAAEVAESLKLASDWLQEGSHAEELRSAES